MIHLINGKTIPQKQTDCIKLNPLIPLSETDGNCGKCAMKQFASTYIWRPATLIYKPVEVVIIGKCPWFLMMQERDRAISKNDSLGQTISAALREIDLLRETLEKNKEYYSVQR